MPNTKYQGQDSPKVDNFRLLRMTTEKYLPGLTGFLLSQE
jgi:hypothetical protein